MEFSVRPGSDNKKKKTSTESWNIMLKAKDKLTLLVIHSNPTHAIPVNEKIKKDNYEMG